MTKKKSPRVSSMPTALDQARDELFSHILRCGVLEAGPEHQKEWIDDTMGYISERYPNLGEEALAKVRTLGERFCQPVVRHPAVNEVAEPDAESTESIEEEETADATV